MTQTNDAPSSAPPSGASNPPPPSGASSPPPPSVGASIAPAGSEGSSFVFDPAVRLLWTEHARAVTEAAEACVDRAERALLLSEAADVDERVRGDELAAARNDLAAVNSAPKFRPPMDALLRMYLRRHNAANLLKLCDAMIRGSGGGRARAEALRLKAEVLEDRAGDGAGAREAYLQAVEADPDDRSAWVALERVGRRAGDVELARRATVRLAELTTDSARKARLLCELAREHAAERTPIALDRASELYRAAGLERDRWRTFVEFERFAEAHGRAEDHAFALASLASLAERVAKGEGDGDPDARVVSWSANPERARRVAADLWSRAARVRAGAVGDGGAAIRALDAALALAPDEPRYWLELLFIADRNGDVGRSTEAARWLLERDAVEPTMRAGLLYRLAEQASGEADADRATALLREVAGLLPEGAAAVATLFDQRLIDGDAAGAVAILDGLAESEPVGPARSALLRAGAGACLAVQGDLDGARRRLAAAADGDAGDAMARRAWLALLPKRPDEASALRAVAYLDALIDAESGEGPRCVLLLEKLWIEREVLGRPAASTAEQLARAGERWAMPFAVAWSAGAGSWAVAAKWSEEMIGGAGDRERADYAAASARLHLAAGDAVRARELALAALGEDPSDPFAATLAFRLALGARESLAALDVLLVRADRLEDEAAARWLTMGAVFLAAAGATAESRAALERASERDPASPAVRAALLATTRWRADTALRERLSEAALSSDGGGDEETALGVQLALARLFLEHDGAGASETLERVSARALGDSLAVSLLETVVTGSRLGPDARGTLDLLHAALRAMPSSDPLRIPFELEVARAMSASADMAEQARDLREMLDGESRGSAAPRLLALLDVVQREDRRDLGTALDRVAEGADAKTAAALRSAAIAALRAQGRESEARMFAMAHPDLPASAIALSEMSVGLEHAAAKVVGLAGRAAIVTQPAERHALLRRAAVWASAAGRADDALSRAEALIEADPGDLVAWDLVRVNARRLKRWRRVVDACLALTARAQDGERVAVLWEEAGVTLFDQLQRLRESEAPLRRAVELDPARDMAYKRLRILLEARKDFANLEALVTLRAGAAVSDAERVTLLWEQARLRRALGRREEALESAVQVVEREPEHVAALALLAEVHATSGRLEEAAEALVRLSTAKETPVSQRRVARQGAIDIFEHRLKLPPRAIELLARMVSEGEANDGTVERGVSLAMSSGLWEDALRFARVAADRAQEPNARCRQLLRVCEIQRDRLRDRAGALRTARAAHDVVPSELAALRAVHGLADDLERAQRARRTIEALRDAIRHEGAGGEAARRIAFAAELGGDGALTRAALRVARALGEDLPAVAASAPGGRASLKDPGLALRVRDPQDTGPLVSLVDTVLPDLVELSGCSTDAFGVGRSERVRGASPLRDALAPYAQVTGLGDFDLYVGGNDDGRIAVVPGSTAAVVLGRRASGALDEMGRFRLVRAMLLAARRVSAIDGLGVDGAADALLAAMAAADLPVPGGTARIEARLKPVAKAISRRTRKATAEMARPLSATPDARGELARAIRAVLSTARRGAVAVTGAVAPAMMELMRVSADESSRRELVLFALSDGAVSVSRETGVDRG
jgi:tetratricopeptide (TPR) repeat protein